MKTFIAGLMLTVAFSAFADSRLEDSASAINCGGRVELRSYIDENTGSEKFALQVIDLQKCSNLSLSTGKTYKVGQNKSANYTLSAEAVAQAKSVNGLGIAVHSNSGKTGDELVVRVREQYVPSNNAPASEW